MRMKIEIIVDYDEATVDNEEYLRRALEQEILSEIHEGMLTPTMTEVVDEYSFSVKVEKC